MLEVFTTSKFDNQIALINGAQSYTFSELKSLITSRIRSIRLMNDNVVIQSGDNFSFVVNFFASIYSNKNIYLITDKSKLNNLEFKYSLLSEKFETKIDTKYALPLIDPNQIVINFFTSGSSGQAKIIQKSLFNLIKEGKDLGEELGIKGDLSVLSTTSMCHLFGMTFHLMFALSNGYAINTTPVAYPENVNVKNSILVSTPAFLSTKVKHNLIFTCNPKYIISAGSKLEDCVFEELEKNSNIVEIYGSTETGVIAYRKEHDKKLMVFSNVNIQPYENNVEVKSDYIYGGSCFINDKVELIGRELTVKNRTDRLFKIYDKRVSAEELEEKLNSHEFVDSSFIMSHDNKLVCLCSLSSIGKEFLLQNNIFSLTKRLKLFMLEFSEIVPQRWRFIDQIPMNQAGKIDTKLVKHLFNVNLSLPVILDRKLEKNSIEYKIFIYGNSNFFNGHFPQYKLVPGVVQLYLAKEFANAHFGLKLGAGQYKRIKFSGTIEPDSTVTLKLTKTEKQVMYEYYSDEKKYSSGVFDIENAFEE